jgi:hypothetical protein
MRVSFTNHDYSHTHRSSTEVNTYLRAACISDALRTMRRPAGLLLIAAACSVPAVVSLLCPVSTALRDCSSRACALTPSAPAHCCSTQMSRGLSMSLQRLPKRTLRVLLPQVPTWEQVSQSSAHIFSTLDNRAAPLTSINKCS